MRAITGALSSMVEAPVVDKTGLTGTYNYTLQFGRDWSAHDPDSWPSIFTAVQEQLGLKLEAVHESVPNLVVDHITKPTGKLIHALSERVLRIECNPEVLKPLSIERAFSPWVRLGLGPRATPQAGIGRACGALGSCVRFRL